MFRVRPVASQRVGRGPGHVSRHYGSKHIQGHDAGAGASGVAVKVSQSQNQKPARRASRAAVTNSRHLSANVHARLLDICWTHKGDRELSH
jgi:hypothetical protein